MFRAASIWAAPALLLLLSPAQAAPGDAGDPGASPSPQDAARRLDRTRHGDSIVAQRDLPDAVQLTGTVRSDAGTPLSGVRVKLFANGVMVESAMSGADGGFSLSANPMSGENHTTDIWFESPDPKEYLDVNVLLSAGRVARERQLYPACTPTLQLSPTNSVLDVTMRSQAEQKKALAESGCLQTGS